MVNQFINKNYSHLIKVAKNVCFKRYKFYEPHDVVTILVEHLHAKKITDKIHDEGRLLAYCITFIKNQIDWTNSELALDFTLKDHNALSDDLTEEEVEENTDDEDIECLMLNIKKLPKYERELMHLIYFEKKSVIQICREMKFQLTRRMIDLDLKKIKEKLQKECG